MPSAKEAAEGYIERNGIKRKPCQVCSGKSLDMHHPDGRKPLEVSFLCRSCHMKVEGGQIKEPKPYNLRDLVNNKGGGDIPSQSNLVVHMATAQFNRYEGFEGRQHLIAPVIAIVGGVVNGELAPAEEIGKYVDSWNGIPLPLDHPMDRGAPISANRPDLIESRSLGRFWNASFDGARLHGELWLDVEKARQMGGDALTVLERLEGGQPLEVSTAYFRDVESVSGTYNDLPYQGIQRNMRPDHLALLPSSIGACSWEDGAGAPRVNERKGGEEVGMLAYMKKLLGGLPWLNQDVSHDEVSELLEQAMTVEKGDALRFMIKERFDDHFVYQEAVPEGSFTGRLFKRQYSIDENHNAVLGDQEEVRKVTTYEPVTNEEISPTGNTGNTTGGEQTLPNKEKVEGLIANQATKWTAEDRSFLEGLTEEQLNKLEPIVAPPAANHEEPTAEQTKQTEEEEEEKSPQNFDEWVEAIPDEEIREDMKDNRKKNQEKRVKLIENLAANERCAFDKEDLQSMRTPQLTKLAHSLQPEDYSGLGGPRSNEQEDDAVIPPPPPVVLAKRRTEQTGEVS